MRDQPLGWEAEAEALDVPALASSIAQTDFPSFSIHMGVTRNAIRFARGWHEGQHRASDQARFILHPLEVGSLLYNCGASDEVVAAGVLHDVVEDTGATLDLLHRRFGPAVAGLVAAVTEDPRIEPERMRKAALRHQVEAAGRDAAMIFAADKVAKVRELRTEITHIRHAHESVSPAAGEKLKHYMACLMMLETALTGHPLVRQLRFELEALRALPPLDPAADPPTRR